MDDSKATNKRGMPLKDPKAIIAIAVVAILVIAGIAVVVVNNNNKGGSTTHDKLADMTWDEIVKKAEGTEVKIAFYFDEPCMKWFNNTMVPAAKEKYNITLTCVGYKDANAAINEYKASGSIPYEFVWGRASNLLSLINYDGNKSSLLLQSDWESKMPNMKYSDGLADQSWKATYESVYGAGSYSRSVCSVAPFSGSTTSFVFNKAFNDDTIAWNEVKITDISTKSVKIIKIANEGTSLSKTAAFADIDETKTYKISDVRAYRVAQQDSSVKIVYGLPSNYTELNSWSKIYQGQFYLPSAATTGGASFHVQLILEAMIYELASKGSSWVSCLDETADVWSGDLKGKYKENDDEANKATYMTYVNEKILKNVTDATSYATQIPYVKAYLQDTAQYWNKDLTGTTKTVTEPNQSLVGNKDTTQKDWNDSTIMIALNSTESLANRTYMYTADIGVYAPDTVCSNRCGLFLLDHTPNPYGGIVIANLFNDPSMQASYYSISGNGYNIDLDKVSSDQKSVFSTLWSEWDSFSKPYISPDQIKTNMVMPAVGYLESYLSKAMDAYIKA